MTIDKAKLKALAEAANAVTGAANVEITICSEAGPNQAEIDAVTTFAGVSTPAAVLALLAEIDRIKARLCVCRDCAGRGEIYSGRDSYQGHHQPPEPDMDVCGTCGGDGVLGLLEDFEALAADRDQLKAENEALRKDAERYRAIRDDIPHIDLGRAILDVQSAAEYDSAVDAAMGKGEQP